MTAWDAGNRIRDEDYTRIHREVNTRIWWKIGSRIQQEPYYRIALEAQDRIRRVANERTTQ